MGAAVATRRTDDENMSLPGMYGPWVEGGSRSLRREEWRLLVSLFCECGTGRVRGGKDNRSLINQDVDITKHVETLDNGCLVFLSCYLSIDVFIYRIQITVA